MQAVINTDDVLVRLALKDIQQVRDSVDAALDPAHVVVQGILCTKFDKLAHVDTFFLNSSYFPPNAARLLYLRLTQGFVWPETLIVATAETRAGLLIGDSVVAEDYSLDALRGILSIEDKHGDAWVTVAYTAGFDNNVHKAPDWLQEAVLAFIPHLLTVPAVADAGQVRANNEAAKNDYEIAAKIVEPYLRNSSFQYLPQIAA